MSIGGKKKGDRCVTACRERNSVVAALPIQGRVKLLIKNRGRGDALRARSHGSGKGRLISPWPTARAEVTAAVADPGFWACLRGKTLVSTSTPSL